MNISSFFWTIFLTVSVKHLLFFPPFIFIFIHVQGKREVFTPVYLGQYSVRWKWDVQQAFLAALRAWQAAVHNAYVKLYSLRVFIILPISFSFLYKILQGHWRTAGDAVAVCSCYGCYGMLQHGCGAGTNQRNHRCKLAVMLPFLTFDSTFDH